MPNEEHVRRAKLFLSFNALKGFRKYLQKQERIVVEPKTLSEDDREVLDRKIHYVEKGKIIKIISFDRGEYIELEGMVSKIDLDYKKTIQIVNKIIPIKQIVDIQSDYFPESY